MRMQNLVLFCLLFAGLLFAASVPAQTAQGTAFTYQGQLLQNNAPVSGNVDMVFDLFDSAAATNQIGTSVLLNAVPVQNGIFTVALDFGPLAFNTLVSDERYLRVTINNTVLSPLTKIENAPYALQSRAAELAYSVSNSSIGSAQIIPAQVQLRVSQSCGSGSAISVINQDGTVGCQSSGNGTITGVTAGTGLSGGGTAGSVSVSADTAYLQRRVNGTCASGSSIRTVNGDGTVACQPAGTGTVTSVSAGTGLTGGTITSSGTLAVDPTQVAMAGTTWNLAGNANVGSGFLGTTDGSPLMFKADNVQAGQLQAPTLPAGAADSVNVILGSAANSVGAGVYGATIGGGGMRFCSPTPCTPNAFGNSVTGVTGTVAGGSSNLSSGFGAFVGGGNANSANGTYSAVSGGWVNSANSDYAMVPGGIANKAGGFASFAGGSYAHVRSAADTGSSGDNGTFVWADYTGSSSNQFTSSGINQFLVRAGGGVGINTTPYIPDVELTIQSSATASSPNADVVMLPRDSVYGFNLSVSGTTQSDAVFAIQTTANNFAKVFTIDAAGNATVNQGNLTLAGAAAQAYKPGGGSWAAPSDLRLKRDIRPLEHVLDDLLQLRGVTFEYVRPDEQLHPTGRHTGFIAQQVQQVFPEWVGNTPDGYLTVGPKGFEALTVEALRELRAEKDAQIEQLARDNADLRARLERLEAQVAGATSR